MTGLSSAYCATRQISVSSKDLSAYERRAYEDYMVSVHAAKDVYETAVAEGRAEGRAEERIANARSLIANGVPKDVIIKSLGLTSEEIELL